MPGETTTRGAQDPLIYLVDDDEPLLNFAEVALLQEGYALKKFLNPTAAYEAFSNEPHKPVLLLTDFAMGSMNGLELSAKCKSAHPALKVLLVSGTAGPEVIKASAVSVDQFLHKPYEAEELARAVRSLLSV